MMTSLGPAALAGHIAQARSEGAPAVTAQAPAAGAAAVRTPQPSRLIIDRDHQSGSYAFTVVDARTGAVMSRYPVRTVRDMASAADYRPGSVARLSV